MNTPFKPQLHKHIVMPSCLQLSLKYKWFEMTKAGIKTEDYREINHYWIKRLMTKKYNTIYSFYFYFPLIALHRKNTAYNTM